MIDARVLVLSPRLAKIFSGDVARVMSTTCTTAWTSKSKGRNVAVNLTQLIVCKLVMRSSDPITIQRRTKEIDWRICVVSRIIKFYPVSRISTMRRPLQMSGNVSDLYGFSLNDQTLYNYSSL